MISPCQIVISVGLTLLMLVVQSTAATSVLNANSAGCGSVHVSCSSSGDCGTQIVTAITEVRLGGVPCCCLYFFVISLSLSVIFAIFLDILL